MAFIFDKRFHFCTLSGNNSARRCGRIAARLDRAGHVLRNRACRMSA